MTTRNTLVEARDRAQTKRDEALRRVNEFGGEGSGDDVVFAAAERAFLRAERDLVAYDRQALLMTAEAGR